MKIKDLRLESLYLHEGHVVKLLAVLADGRVCVSPDWETVFWTRASKLSEYNCVESYSI